MEGRVVGDDWWRRELTALLSSALDCGENTAMVAGVVPGVTLIQHAVLAIDPDDASNIFSLLAFEQTHAALQSVCLNDTDLANM